LGGIKTNLSMNRRHFIQLTAAGTAAVLYSKLTFAAPGGTTLIKHPDDAWALIGDKWIKLTGTGNAFTYRDLRVIVTTKGDGQGVFVQSPSESLQAIKLKWRYDATRFTTMLGDHWERSYGDLSWKTPNPDFKNPWYVLLHDASTTAGFGVKTGCNTICWWNVAPEYLELTLDTQSGGAGVKLGDRKLHAADIVTILSLAGENPYATATRFCGLMCAKPRLPKQPVYGINDWYAVYGNNSAESIVRQTAVMAELVGDTANRPFSVIDDGWEQPDDFSKWNKKFKDMHESADAIKRLGMRPGLWTRALIAKLSDSQAMIAPKIPGRNDPQSPILDPTVPETLDRIKHNIEQYRAWGYEMIKHDYSTYDIFGKWGSHMNSSFTAPGWNFYDQSRTNAEIINNLYRVIRQAAGNMYVIGCNTISHLSAGVFELNRIGDDTSGKEWSRTLKMGVNTLGFRLPQHNTFYAADGDCVGLTAAIPWEKNRQWLQLLAESGAPLFISAEIAALTSEQKAAIRTAFAQAAKPQPTGEPLDWLSNPLPAKWKLNGREVNFKWE
jgi:alpha-galactosidase